jgi:hypothetical protein
MILSTQHLSPQARKFAPTIFVLPKERDIPKYTTMWVMDIPMGQGLPWCMLSYLIGCLKFLWFPEISIPKIVCFVSSPFLASVNS